MAGILIERQVATERIQDCRHGKLLANGLDLPSQKVK
jgi:hypothetical protein